MSIESVMPSSHLILCHLLLLLSSIFPSIRVFSKESVLCIRWLKYWSFSISPCNEYWGLISFRIDWLDLLAVQGTLKSLLQHQVQNCSEQLPHTIEMHNPTCLQHRRSSSPAWQVSLQGWPALSQVEICRGYCLPWLGSFHSDELHLKTVIYSKP